MNLRLGVDERILRTGVFKQGLVKKKWGWLNGSVDKFGRGIKLHEKR